MDNIEPIAKNVFERRRMNPAIRCIYRYLTRDHGSKTDLMIPWQYWTAIGSAQSIGVYLARSVKHLRIREQEANSEISRNMR